MLDRKPVRLDPRLPWLERTRRFLSPMSGVTDRPFREVCRRFGADIGFCEFVSASGLTYGGEHSWRLVDTAGEEGLVGVQIFGAEPDHMARATELLMDHRLDVLDINFGCPAKKVVKKCGGSALLADLPLLETIVRRIMDASTVPVTAKIRTGWDEDSVNYVETGRLLQDLGYSFELGVDGHSGEALREDGLYYYHPDHGLVESLGVAEPGQPSYMGTDLLKLSQGDFEGGARLCAKRLMRQALAVHLGDTPLRSRELFRTRRRTGEVKQ